jgi:hypothetical protein
VHIQWPCVLLRVCVPPQCSVRAIACVSTCACVLVSEHDCVLNSLCRDVHCRGVRQRGQCSGTALVIQYHHRGTDGYWNCFGSYWDWIRALPPRLHQCLPYIVDNTADPHVQHRPIFLLSNKAGDARWKVHHCTDPDTVHDVVFHQKPARGTPS